MHALLLAENHDESAVLSLVLQRAGMTVTVGPNVDDALRNNTTTDQPIDLTLLARTDKPPHAQAQEVRAETLSPLVMVLNWANEELHYELLESGVDLVVVRPFSARLLIAQLRALLRRSATSPLFTLPTLQVDDLTLEPATRTVLIKDKPRQHLTHLEFRLLHTLMVNHNQIIPTDTIVEQVWGYHEKGDRNLVRGLISRLRAKVEDDPHHPVYILNAPGVGYSFKHTDEVL